MEWFNFKVFLWEFTVNGIFCSEIYSIKRIPCWKILLTNKFNVNLIRAKKFVDKTYNEQDSHFHAKLILDQGSTDHKLQISKLNLLLNFKDQTFSVLKQQKI